MTISSYNDNDKMKKQNNKNLTILNNKKLDMLKKKQKKTKDVYLFQSILYEQY